MSTRGIILVMGKTNYGHDKTVRLYKHCDSYPSGNLPLIAEALVKAKEQCGEHNQRFQGSNSVSSTVDQVVGLLIGAATDVYGMGARIDTDGDHEEKHAIFNEKFKPKHLGWQHDLEWIYVIDLNSNSVKVYGGGYSGESPQYAYRKGMIDPLTYAEQLKEEYQDQEREHIKDAIKVIEAIGFKVNPRQKRRRKIEGTSSRAFDVMSNVIPLKAAA